MTNKPTWAEDLKTLCEKYCNCIDAYTGRHMIDPSCTYHQVWEEGIIEHFISTKLAEQRKELIGKVEKLKYQQPLLGTPLHTEELISAVNQTIEEVLNLIKQD